MSTLFDYAHAKKLRDIGIEQAGSWPASEWVSKARAFAVSYARAHGSVDADIVNQHVPRPPDISPNSAGSIFRCRELEPYGFKNSSKVSSHARVIRKYRIRSKE